MKHFGEYPPDYPPGRAVTAIIGIDPGQSGGIALLQGGEALVWKMPDTERDLWDLMAARHCDGIAAYMESVHSFPGQGVSSSFKFGVGYGGLRMALIAAEIPFTTVAPGVWQRSMGCLSKGVKNVTKRRAQELFPSIKITHALADCLLIAAYGWLQQTGRPWPSSREGDGTNPSEIGL